jgi:NTP pyrophosphatase (non-canonical NTP hydrolase)
MDFSTYQRKSRKTAVYPKLGRNPVYPTLGLAGEAGEVAEKVKKMIRDDRGRLTAQRAQDIALELGDVLWYVANLASELSMKLDAIASMNLRKLESRRRRGVVGGSGDRR